MKKETEEELFDKIEAYLKGDLSKEEEALFQKALLENSILKEKVEKHKFIHSSFDNDLIDFQNKLSKIREVTNQDSEIQSNVPKVQSFFILKIAAFIIVIIGVAYSVWQVSIDNESDLFEKYYSPYPVEHVLRGENETELGLVEYSNADYEQAVFSLTQLIKEQPQNNYLKLYLANSYLNIGKYDMTISLLKSINMQENISEDANWYLALTYLKKGQKDQSIYHLKKVIDIDGKYRAYSSELLSNLLEQH